MSQVRWMLGMLLLAAFHGTAQAESVVVCDFNALTEGQVDGQAGWDVYDKVKDSSAFSVVDALGISDEDGDRALIVKASSVPIRCVTDEAVRWLRKQTLRVEYDFRLVVPKEDVGESRPVMVACIGNSVLNEKARWAVSIQLSTNGAWILSASLPDEASRTVPARSLSWAEGESVRISDWMHCVIEVEKSPELDRFSSRVQILDRDGAPIVSLTCSDNNRDSVTKAMWNLSRGHAGFYAAQDHFGLACIDNFRIATLP